MLDAAEEGGDPFIARGTGGGLNLLLERALKLMVVVLDTEQIRGAQRAQGLGSELGHSGKGGAPTLSRKSEVEQFFAAARRHHSPRPSASARVGDTLAIGLEFIGAVFRVVQIIEEARVIGLLECLPVSTRGTWKFRERGWSRRGRSNHLNLRWSEHPGRHSTSDGGSDTEGNTIL